MGSGYNQSEMLEREFNIAFEQLAYTRPESESDAECGFVFVFWADQDSLALKGYGSTVKQCAIDLLGKLGAV